MVLLGCLVVATTVLVTLSRWAVWRWLAVLAALPVLLAGMGGMDSLPGTGSMAYALLTSAALSLFGWRAGTGRTIVVVVAALLLVALGATRVIDADPWSARPALLLVPAAIGLLAVLGLGRAEGSSMRLVTATSLAAPTVVLATSGGDLLTALAWWPAAGALGLTALLRGRRGDSAQSSQVDELDRVALAAVAAELAVVRLRPVAVVIAAYNEAEGLPAVLSAIPDDVCGLPVDVIVVDDGSTDGTAEAARAVGRARVVVSTPNRGQGAALRLGYRIAREHDASYIVTTDADGQYDVGDLPTVLQPVVDGHADFVSGSRLLGHQHTHDRVRRLGVHVFAWLATGLLGRRVTDTSFGLRAMRAVVTARVTLNQPQYQSSELLVGVVSHGFRLLEVPATMHVRSAGASKKGRNLVYGSRYAKVMLGTWWREGCPAPVADRAPALRRSSHHVPA